MLYQANLDPIIIDCEQPPVTVAWLLRDLLDTELPKTHDQGPPIIRDTLCDEQGIYFDMPVEIKETDGVFVLRIKGSVWTWDGEQYLPNNEHVDVLDVEILPSGTGGSKVRVMPAFALGGIEKHIEALVARVFGGLDDAPEIPRDSERAAGNVTSTEAAGHRLAKRLDDAVDRVLEDASRLAGAVMEGAKPTMEPRAAATGEKSAEVAPASEEPADLTGDSRMRAAKVNTAVGSAARRAEKPDNGSLNGMPTRYSSYPIRGAGLRTRTIEEVRKAEANGTPMHYDSYPVPLDRVAAIASRLNGVWQEEWLSARELPGYVLRDRDRLLDMGISLMPRLLGPHQCEEQTRWDATQHDCDDPALMGHIVAKQMASDRTFIEFWLGGFPDLSMFDEMQRALEDEIVLILMSRVREDRPEPSAPGREDVGDGEVAEEPGEGKMTTSASEHEERESRFTLNTTADHFANLLEHHTQSVYLRFLAVEGQTTLQAARGGRRGGLFTIEMEGVLCTIEGGVKATQRIGPAISFEVIPLSDERIDVTAKCVQPTPAVKSYFDELMKEIERWYPEVREQREAEIARLRARADRLLQEIDQEIQGEVKRILVPLERWDVFRHLRALCNNDARFSILQAKTDEDLERLTITDTQATKPLGTARGAVIGTVRLLPVGSSTEIMFVAKDALFHLEITDEGKVLFREFQQRVEEHFDDLRLPTPTSDRTPHPLTFEEMGYRNPRDETQKAREPGEGEPGKVSRRGPTARTQTRGDVFKRLKDAHPTWSQARVAMEASKEEELNEQVTEATVRNTYRLLGWKWERADRIR